MAVNKLTKKIHLSQKEKEIVYAQCKTCRFWVRPFGCHCSIGADNRPVKDCEEYKT